MDRETVEGGILWQSLRRLGELAEQHDFAIVADEIYEKLLYGKRTHFSIASISPAVRDRTITVNGFSKTYAITGWRRRRLLRRWWLLFPEKPSTLGERSGSPIPISWKSWGRPWIAWRRR